MIKTATVPTTAQTVSYLTSGKSYNIIENREHAFDILDDQGEKITALKNNDIQLGFTNMGSAYKDWILE
jgi:hypothetical protein|nr:MAG TPA: hypothetical protein [Caudoviricetes sp.]